MAYFSFNTANVAPDTSRDLLPAGVYNARIIESSVAPLKSGNGDGLKLTFEIIDGPSAKRRVWTSLNVKHINPDTQKWGQQDLRKICVAVGVPNMEDTTQLHNRPLKIKVIIKKDEGYGDKNEVKGYEPAAAGFAAVPPAIQTQSTAAAPAQTAAKPSAPWAAARG